MPHHAAPTSGTSVRDRMTEPDRQRHGPRERVAQRAERACTVLFMTILPLIDTLPDVPPTSKLGQIRSLLQHAQACTA